MFPTESSNELYFSLFAYRSVSNGASRAPESDPQLLLVFVSAGQPPGPRTGGAAGVARARLDNCPDVVQSYRAGIN